MRQATKLFHAGEKGRAICPDCKRVTPTTFAYRDVPFDDGSGIVKDILAAVCDVCGIVAAIPAQITLFARATTASNNT